MSAETFNTWSNTLTALGMAVVWQSAVLGGLAAVACWLLKGSSPALRYWCWQIVAVKLLLMPLWTLAIPLPALFAEAPTARPNDAGIQMVKRPGTLAHGIVAADALQPQATPAQAQPEARTSFLGALSWRSWFIIVWLCGVGWQVVWLLIQRRCLQRVLHRTVAASEPRLLALVDELARQLGLRRSPRVRLIDVGISPLVFGMFRPVLLLPTGLFGAVDEAAWRQILLHELAHIKRRDLLWGWIPEIARMLHFFNPVAHWVCSRIRLERELACDQIAMAHSGKDAGDYALTLVSVVSHASLPPALQTVAALAPASHSGGPGFEPPSENEGENA